MDKGRISKPRNNNFKTSDRRLASGSRPEAYLLAKANGSIKPVVASTTTKAVDPKQKVYKLFVGNLGSDATEDTLRRAFAQYTSLTSVEVPLNKGVNKGFGFVGMTDTKQYLAAFKEMQGKYVGHHPCVLKRAK